MALPAFLNPIVNAPASQKLVAGIMGLLVICGVSYVFLLQPVMTHIDELRPEVAKLQGEVTQNRRILADLMKFRREAAELLGNVEVSQQAVADERGAVCRLRGGRPKHFLVIRARLFDAARMRKC